MMASEGWFHNTATSTTNIMLGLLLMRALALWHDCRPVKITLIVFYIVLHKDI